VIYAKDLIICFFVYSNTFFLVCIDCFLNISSYLVYGLPSLGLAFWKFADSFLLLDSNLFYERLRDLDFLWTIASGGELI